MLPRDAAYTLRSAIRVDTVAGAVTLPLHHGFVDRRGVWYVVTESSDSADAVRRGVTWSPRLRRLLGTKAAQRGTELDGALHFTSGVDFTPVARLRAAADSGFPPAEAAPGSVGEKLYSPFVELLNGTVLNAPIVGDYQSAIERVIALDPSHNAVTIRLTRGYGLGKTVWYFSTEASDPVVATMEGATWAPTLAEAPGLADASSATSARTGLIAVVNGETGRNSLERQGLQSALLDHESPLNVLQHLPDRSLRDLSYSPLWDLHLARWTSSAIATGQRQKLFSWSETAAAVGRGTVVSGGPGKPNPVLGGLNGVGVAVNCPVMAVFDRPNQ